MLKDREEGEGMRLILFVCTGNTCRSPMAEAMARKMGLDAQSAGLSAAPGMPASPQAIRAARRHGADLSGHRARQMNAALAEAAALICPMTLQHARLLRAQYPHCAEKILLPPLEIPDPYGGEDQEYESCIQSLIAMVGKLKAD